MEEDEKTRLMNSISKETEFFSTIIDCIPPEHFGYDDETREILKERKHELVDEKLGPGKRATLSNKSKGRLARLDDRQCRTNSQISAYLLEISKRNGKGKKRKRNDDEFADQPKTTGQSVQKKRKAGGAASGTANGPVSSDRQDLLTKLQAKLKEMREKRGMGATHGIDHEEKKRMKRRLSKAKLKEKRRKEKDQGQRPAGIGEKVSKDQAQKPTPQSTTSKKMTNGHQPNVAAKTQTTGGPSNKRLKQNDATPSSTAPSRKPAIVDKDGRMVFSKFDFALPGVVEDTEKDKWAKKNSGKDYKRLLEKQERLEGKLKQLEEKDDFEGAKKLKSKTQWDAAAQRAKGGKVKDDTNLLKKNLKRKEQRKQQTKRKWDSRNDVVQRKQQEKQEKRRENIQARKKDKKDRKLTKARKKGRIV